MSLDVELDIIDMNEQSNMFHISWKSSKIMCKLFKQVCPYKYEKPLEYIKLSGTQMCKTDIVYRLLCTLADTDHHGLELDNLDPGFVF